MMFRKIWFLSLVIVLLAKPSAASYAVREMCSATAIVEKGQQVTFYARMYAQPNGHGDTTNKWVHIEFTNLANGEAPQSNIFDYGQTLVSQYIVKQNGSATATGSLWMLDGHSERPEDQNRCELSVEVNANPAQVATKKLLAGMAAGCKRPF